MLNKQKMMYRIGLLLAFCAILCRGQNTTANPTTTTPAITTNITTITTNITTASTSTTAAPTTTEIKTTTQIPTTTPIPSPPTPPTPPAADVSNWNFTDKSNQTCILLTAGIQIKIAYNDSSNQTLTTGFNIPSDATVDELASSCTFNDNATILQVLVLNFNTINETSGYLRLVFKKSENNVYVEKIELKYKLSKELFPDYINQTEIDKNVEAIIKDGELFKVDSDYSYTCGSADVLLLNQNLTLQTNGADLSLSALKIQAYLSPGAKGHFGAARSCDNSEVSDVVPIAVGASLAALVVIVLIAYFVGRRRSRRLAYQSV